jgi:hypothetical protein
MAEETKRARYSRRLTALRNERASFIDHYKDINLFLLPRRGRFMTTDRNKGDKRNTKIIDSEATMALSILVSGMMSGVTSPARRWFRLATPDREMMEFGPVKEWLRQVEDVMYEVFRESNLYQVIPSVYEEMAAYGTAAMIQLDDFDDVARFQAFTVGEYAIAQNHRYQVDTIYREIEMTVEQIVGRFVDQGGGEMDWSNTSQAVKNLWDSGTYDSWIPTVHLIEPRQDRDEDSKLAKDMAFASVIYEVGGDDEKLLEDSGFRTFPCYVPRWHLTPPDIYGRGPGMDALGDIKQLQDQQKKKGQAISKHVNPPMTAPSSLKNQRMSTLPGDVTFVDAAQGQQGYVPAYQVQPRLADFVADMEDVRQRIRRCFHSDLFLMLAQSDRRQITATEIQERREEKLLVLGPVLERINHDLLDPMIDNTFERVMEVGIAPPPPPELQDAQLQIEYISIMAMAQRSQGIIGIQDTAGFVGNLAAINPEAIDKLDFDQAVDEYGEMRGVPPGIIRSDEAVGGIREGRAQQQQMARQAEGAERAVAGAKSLADTDTTEGNMLSDILGGLSG